MSQPWLLGSHHLLMSAEAPQDHLWAQHALPYAKCYCEENVYRLAELLLNRNPIGQRGLHDGTIERLCKLGPLDFSERTLYATFISNDNK